MLKFIHITKPKELTRKKNFTNWLNEGKKTKEKNANKSKQNECSILLFFNLVEVKYNTC